MPQAHAHTHTHATNKHTHTRAQNVIEYFWAMRKLFSLAKAPEKSVENIMKNRLNFVAAAGAEMYATVFFFVWLIPPYGKWQETRRVQITLIKYKNLWLAYYEYRRQQTQTYWAAYRVPDIRFRQPISSALLLIVYVYVQSYLNCKRKKPKRFVYSIY